MRLKGKSLTEDLQRWQKAYLEHIRLLGYAKNTLSLYRRSTDSFVEYMREFEEDIAIDKITSVYFTGFLGHIEKEASRRKGGKGKALSGATKQAYLKAIRGMFEFIGDNNDEFITYTRALKAVKVADRTNSEEKIKYITEAEMAPLLALLEKKKNLAKTEVAEFLANRNALLVKILLYAGLRISEALALKMKDVTPPASRDDVWMLRVQGKGGKRADAFLASGIIDEEFDFISNVKNESKENDFLFFAYGGKGASPLNRTSIYRVVNRIYKKAGVGKTGLHILRHTLAIRLTKKNVNPIVIQKILRHSSLSTTTVYAKAEKEDVRGALKGI